jgi:phosphoglycerate dehydrogenase-like enzyme
VRSFFVPSDFQVYQTADFFDATGQPRFADLGLSVFDGASHIRVKPFAEHRPEISSEQLMGAQGVIVLTPRVTRNTLAQSENLLAVGRFGVGFDSVDVPACTDHDVLAMITTGAVDRPVAEATVAWMLAMSHHLIIKDQLVRTGRWDDRTKYMGFELRDRTLGVIGLGGIGRHLIGLLKGFGMNQPIFFDPFVRPETAAELGARSVTLDELMAQADFVSVHCPLNDKTRNLIGARELALMKPGAWLLNTARGGIVNEDALFDVLKNRRIAGAALDCFDNEPVTTPHRFGQFDNVVLAPHSIAWTGEMFRDIGRTSCQSMLDLSLGKRPIGVLNSELFERESFRTKWSRITGIPVGQLQ